MDIREEDLGIVKDIYDYYIENTTATYYTNKVSIEELKGFIPVQHKKYKSFLIKVDKECCGFCYISHYNKRPAYDRTAEVTLYLRPEYTGKGIGKLALDHLESVAKQHGISVLIGIISEDNIHSQKAFQNSGYEKCGHLREVGEKFNKILDVVFYSKILAQTFA